MRKSLWLFSICAFLFLGSAIYAQQAPAPAATPDDAASLCKVIDSSKPDYQAKCEQLKNLRAQMRDNQWQQSKASIQMNNLASQWNDLKNKVNNYATALEVMSDKAMSITGVDRSKMIFNYDTLTIDPVQKPGTAAPVTPQTPVASPADTRPKEPAQPAHAPVKKSPDSK